MDLNKVMLIGNVTRDPEVRTTTQGTPVATFSVATNLRWTNTAGERQEKAEVHNVVAWRKLADICGQMVKRGSKLYVEGRLQTRSWDDAQGQKHWRTEVVADNIILLDRANKGTVSTEAAAAAPEAPAEDSPINVEDIPF
ncbi:MAG: single-stranded DNA-binding protein [Candidatus Kerfeldbacteria bacterium]|nr:single-stranded DNA-binding protein [Candidatus Kerfeldbacteria bacterium]